MSPDSLPVRLRQARGTLPLAQAAVLSGIDEERIREYEEGTRRPYGKTLKRLADAYATTVPELLGTSPPKGFSPSGSGLRRRRRRPNEPAPAQADPETTSVHVPVSLNGNQEIRLVIEVVIRQGGDTGATLRSAQSEPAATEPEATRPEPQPTPAPASRLERYGHRIPVPRALRAPERRPSPVPATARPAGNAEDARDPLGEFRQAYREFRRDRK